MLTKAFRLFHTLWPLKLTQHWGLFYYRVLRRVVPFKSTKTWATKVEVVEAQFHVYQPVGWKGGMEFEFLNSHATISAATWQAPEQTLLWHYNLHYFDHLNAKNNYHAAADEAKLISAWWQRHQPMQGVPWDPYPTSLRAVNLCKWGWRHNQAFALIAEKEWVAILDRHYQEIKRKLEYHIQANHLFANLKALWFLQAALPEYRAKEGAWLQKQVKRELALQFDVDGGHFELSPMYHRIMLWDVLDMYAVGNQVPSFAAANAAMEALLPKALRWCHALSHPDTQVAFFNDAAIGIAPELEPLIGYANALDVSEGPVANGVYSGYAVVTLGDAHLFCDVAEAGPAIQPGHVHADSLSFELSLGAQRVFVNSGTSEYGASAERLRQRSTAAHNTVTLEGRNSSDVWSGFRVGKQAAIVKRDVELTQDTAMVVGAHNGYQPAVHQRKWIFQANSLCVNDTLAANGQKISRFYLHPNIRVKQQGVNSYVLRWQEGEMLFVAEHGHVETAESTWHPEFGTVQKNICLVVAWQGTECSVQISW